MAIQVYLHPIKKVYVGSTEVYNDTSSENTNSIIISGYENGDHTGSGMIPLSFEKIGIGVNNYYSHDYLFILSGGRSEPGHIYVNYMLNNYNSGDMLFSCGSDDWNDRYCLKEQYIGRELAPNTAIGIYIHHHSYSDNAYKWTLTIMKLT